MNSFKITISSTLFDNCSRILFPVKIEVLDSFFFLSSSFLGWMEVFKAVSMQTRTCAHVHTQTRKAFPAGKGGDSQHGEFCTVNASSTRFYAGHVLTSHLYLCHESLSAPILSLFVLSSVEWIEHRIIQPRRGALSLQRGADES